MDRCLDGKSKHEEEKRVNPAVLGISLKEFVQHRVGAEEGHKRKKIG